MTSKLPINLPATIALRPSLAYAARTAPLLALLLVAGCAQLHTLKSKIAKWPAVSTSRSAATGSSADPASLAAIVNGKLQHGRYAEGKRDLRRYLQQHPGDRTAKAMLSQLTSDPQQELGAASRPHVVQPGESYSTLAARYLGDSGRFLILARYNGSRDPSLLRVGETLRLPTAVPGGWTADSAAKPDDHAVAHDSGTQVADGTPSPAPATNVPAPAPATQAERLQAQSLALLDQGQHAQALTRMDQALTLDPTLPPAGGAKAAALRAELVASYHQRAIVLYRDQQLDPAIALWDRVLAIDPSYEPAAVYRTRALELKHRLKQY